jgi:hypothetical protein
MHENKSPDWEKSLLSSDPNVNFGEAMSDNKIPTVFISYSPENKIHQKWIEDFATRLRSHGLDAKLDKWELSPGDSITRFLETSVRENDFVLLICTPEYKRKFDGRIGHTQFEAEIITGEAFTKQNREKFIPVLRRGTKTESVPAWLMSSVFVDLSGEPYDEDNYTRLLAFLYSEYSFPPPIGARLTDLAPKQLKAARDKYLQFIVATNQHVDTRGIIPSHYSATLNLEEVHITLTVDREVSVPDLEPLLNEIEVGKEDFSQSQRVNIRRQPSSETHFFQSVDLPSAIRNNSRMVILGMPGAGKTTFIRFLALQFARSWSAKR